MRALSLWQPMASALIDGGKRWENRNRRTHVRGLVVIHAASREEEPGYYSTLDRWWPNWWKHDRPRGVLLGIVEITQCRPIEDVRGQPWAYGPWCWGIRPRLKFETPIPFKGGRGFFSVPGSILPDVVDQLICSVDLDHRT